MEKLEKTLEEWQAMLDPEQDTEASLQRVREIFTKYT